MSYDARCAWCPLSLVSRGPTAAAGEGRGEGWGKKREEDAVLGSGAPGWSVGQGGGVLLSHTSLYCTGRLVLASLL